MTSASSLRPRLSTSDLSSPMDKRMGPRENCWSSGMANTEQQERGSVLLGFTKFLPPLHPGFSTCTSDVRPHTEGLRMAVGEAERSPSRHSDSRESPLRFGFRTRLALQSRSDSSDFATEPSSHNISGRRQVASSSLLLQKSQCGGTELRDP